MVLDDGDAEPLEAGDGIVWCNGRDHAVDVVVHFREIDLGLYRCDAKRLSRAHAIGLPGGGEQRFRRHAAGVEAVAAHRIALDEHGAGAHLRGTGGNGQPARARTDDTDISLDSLGHETSIDSSRSEKMICAGMNSIWIRTLARPWPRQTGDRLPAPAPTPQAPVSAR